MPGVPVPDIIELISSLSRLVIQRFSSEAQKLTSEAIGDGIADGVQKSSQRLFSIGVSIALIGTGFFLTLWGIATGIDTFFEMRGFGYVLIGILAALAGVLVYKR
ncbi:hypothetical protein ANME2D_00155 [Candidatus Methanoperedens nitroreducens]|uniref:Uncharacterized protein n=1 Tax=Candidatus Methanoperedens nitratireducens TaxID=1392998 RepID=A0A062V1X1_9EURY|nr:hypothetical protein ANME2D_00155 [Candidatus Methanoperedens nitroreducens]